MTQRYLRSFWAGFLADMPDLSQGACVTIPDAKIAHFEAQGYDGDDRHVSSRTIDLAKRWCRRCSVEVECGSWAIQKDIPDGIYGGLSTEERRKLKRRVA